MAKKTAPRHRPGSTSGLELKPVTLKGCDLAMLRELTREWAARLNIAGVRIRVRFSEVDELPQNASAGSWCRPHARLITIKVKPFHLMEKSDDPDPVEVILIHELLHYYFENPDTALKDQRGPATAYEESSIEGLAWAFFRFKYPGWPDTWANVTQL